MPERKRDAIVLAEDYLITASEAAQILCISRGALYALCKRGELHSLHIGAAFRLRISDVRLYLHDHPESPPHRRRRKPKHPID